MSNDVPDIDVLANFIDEAGQSLATLNSKLLMAESGDCTHELIDEMFRAAHSMKGSAGFLKLNSIQKVTHSLETVLDQVRKEILAFNEDVIGALFLAFDTVSALLAQLTTGDSQEVDITEVVKELEDVSAVVPEKNDPAANPELELGWVPEWLRGRLGIDDVMEALIARNTGQEVYALRFSFSDIFAIGIDPVETFHTFEQKLNIQTVIPLELTESIWQPLSNYDYDVGIFGWGDQSLAEKLSDDFLPEMKLWKLADSKEEKEAVEILPTQVMDTGEPVVILSVREEMFKHLPLWLSETSEELDQLDRALLEFEQDPQQGSKHIGEMFRMMHRLKSSAASMGLSEMARISHNCESLLDRYRQSGDVPDESVFRVLFKAKDVLNECLKRVSNNDTASPVTEELDEELKALISQTSVAPAENKAEWTLDIQGDARADEVLASGGNVFKIKIALQDDVPLADLRYAMILRNIENHGEIICSVPTITELDEGIESPPPLQLLLGCSIGADAVKKIIQVDQVESVKVEQLKAQERKAENGVKASGPAVSASVGASSPAADTVRVDTARLDQMMNVTGELVITKARVNQLSEDISHLLASIDVRGLDAFITQTELHISSSDQKRPMGMTPDKIKRFHAMVAELQKAQDTVGKLRETSLELHRHTSNLQNSVMQARMVPVGPLFQRFHRLVRDVSKSNGRKARLVLSGETTELDKKLIDELSDPLTHLIRNSVDHGLELPEERVLGGKDESGTVYLDAFHEGGHICIRVSDDGRGLAVEKIKAKGIKNGIITEQIAAGMSNEEAFNLIFSPGFSTAAQVTNISGRGVGMDIVKSKITELKGKIDIESEEGKGCAFTIRLPLTLAMIEALLVSIGETCYAFPLESVREIVDVRVEDIHTIKDQGKVIKLRDKVIALVELENVIDAEKLSARGVTRRAVVTKGTGETLAVVVDYVIGEEDVVVKALSEEFAGVVGVSGASVLGDGRIALILDVPSICEKAKEVPDNKFYALDNN